MTGRHLLLLGAGAFALRLAVLALVLTDPAVGLQVDEAQYWDWSRALQWGYYSKPPAIAALIAASTALGGDGVIGVRWLAMATQVAAALALAGLAHDLAAADPRADDPQRPRHAAGWAALIGLSNPIAGLLGLAATTDAPLMLAWTLAAWALWRALHGGRRRDGLAFGLALGAGLLSKYTMAVWLPMLAGLLATARCAPDRRVGIDRVGVALALGLAALLVAPNLLWNAAAGWPTWRHTAEITVQAGRGTAPTDRTALASLAEWLGGQWLMAGPLWLPLWLWQRRRGAATAPLPAAVRTLLWTLTVPLLTLGALQALHATAQINWTAPAMQGVVLALALWLAPAGRQPLRRLAGAVVALHLLIVTALPLVGTAMRAVDGPQALPPRALDLWARMRGWTPAFAALRPALAGQPADAVLIGADRTLIAHGRHAWRDLPGRWHAWRPDTERPPIDHYQLTAGWPAGRPTAERDHPLLIVAEGPALPPGWLLALETPQRLADVQVAQGAGRTLHLTLWRSRWRDTPPGEAR